MASGNKNSAVVLSEKVGVSLEEAVANLELLKKSMPIGASLSNTDQLQLEAERDELKAEKLELQAERAEFKAEKLEWEATKGAGSLSSSTNPDLEAAKAQLKADRLDLEAAKTQLKIAQSKLKDAQAQLEAANSQLETAHKQLDLARAELEVARSHLEAAKAQADIDSAKLEAAKASLEAAKARFQAATTQLNAAKSQFEAAKSQLDSARATFEAENSQLQEDEKAALEKRVSEAESKNARLEKYQLALEKRVSEAESKSARLEKDQLALNSQLQQSKAQVGDLSKQLEQCNEEKKTMQDIELPGLREKVKELEAQMKQCGEHKKNPKVFLDIAINLKEAGRIVIELHYDTTPITAENFRALCTGEKGMRQGGRRLHYRESKFDRVVPQNNFCEGGNLPFGNGKASESIYGPTFRAENLTKKHTGPGVVSMANENNNPQICSGSRFFITAATAQQYDGKYVVFGQVVKGMEVVMKILKAESGASVIYNCGELN